MNIQMALSGQSFTGPDVGGFANDTEGELLARWTQAACLLPFFRNHSAVDTIRQEPWRFGKEVERVCREAIALRYRLMPPLHSLRSVSFLRHTHRATRHRRPRDPGRLLHLGR